MHAFESKSLLCALPVVYIYKNVLQDKKHWNNVHYYCIVYCISLSHSWKLDADGGKFLDFCSSVKVPVGKLTDLDWPDLSFVLIPISTHSNSSSIIPEGLTHVWCLHYTVFMCIWADLYIALASGCGPGKTKHWRRRALGWRAVAQSGHKTLLL